MNCGAATTNAPDSIAMARACAIQPSESSAVGADPDLRPLPVQGVARQRHAVLPADEAADATGGGLDDAQVVAGADAVEEPLVLGRHELAVLVQEPLGTEQHHRVVERPRAVGLALVDPDHGVDAAGPAHGGELVDQRPGTSTELSHIRSHSSSEPPNDAAARAHAFDGYSETKHSGRTASSAPGVGRLVAGGAPPSRRWPRRPGSRASPGSRRRGRCAAPSPGRRLVDHHDRHRRPPVLSEPTLTARNVPVMATAASRGRCPGCGCW